tara:strand:- start:515 stop:685 length:171 start_codon:yes stop_codon:yes gene_type:complete
MTVEVLLVIIVFLIFFFILFIHWCDKNMVRRIKEYEERLEKKGILKRHFSKARNNK